MSHKRQSWTAQDLLDKGYAEVAGKYGKTTAGGGVVGTRCKQMQPPLGNAAQQTTRTRAITAGSNPAPSPYKSKWESSYANKLELERHFGIVKQWWYEPFSLWLPGKVRYKPDFLVQYTEESVLTVLEVKGWSKNKRDGMTRLKIAAALFPCFRWVLASQTKNGWEEVQP